MLKACKINKMNAWFDGFFGELILGLSATVHGHFLKLDNAGNYSICRYFGYYFVMKKTPKTFN